MERDGGAMGVGVSVRTRRKVHTGSPNQERWPPSMPTRGDRRFFYGTNAQTVY
jgi:hypothetical protein